MRQTSYVGYLRNPAPRADRSLSISPMSRPLVALGLFLATALAAGAGAGCATTASTVTPAPTAEGPRVIHMEEVRIQQAADPLTGLDSFDASDLLAKGNGFIEKQEWDQALKLYDHLIATFPTSELVPSALYNSGLAYAGLAENEKALDRFKRVIAEHPSSTTAKDAHYQSCLMLSKLDRWQEVADGFWAIRQKGPLDTMDEIEARAGMAVAMFMLDDYDTAEREFMGVVRLYEERSKTEYVNAQYWVGQARFYLGEIYARRFEKLSLDTSKMDGDSWKDEMAKLLEAKCDLLLRAQNSFIRTIRVGHTGWATAAGFRIGSMYERLYDDMQSVKMPPDLPPDAQPYYRELLTEKISVLVSKAIQVYERSLEMASRVGEQNEWVERTSRALERMKTLAVAAIRG